MNLVNTNTMEKPIATDLETLKAWCHWKRKESDLSESDQDFVKAIEDLISQVGTYRAKLEKAEKQVAVLREALAEFQISHAHNGTEPSYRPYGDAYGWCSICQEKVGLNEDFARDALAEADRLRDEK